MGTTTNYGWAFPVVTGDNDAWGDKLNTLAQDIDTQVFENASSSPAFTPVQQGGGASQGTNKVYLGYDTVNLRVQIDTTDLGKIPTSGATAGFLRNATGSGGLVTKSTAAPSGTPVDGDIWIQYTP